MDGQDGISIRSMRLKVLYTFDDTTNCLARWPHLLDIQTAYLDEGTQIGVIELKTCIQAIVSASPELVAELGRDYTVYAYDYSEYETPLVGQGMLSWVLASASSTPDAPAHQSKTIVTGRVVKNALGQLFARGAQETLEVKLRLVPVPTSLQSEYLSSMQKYRELSNVIPHDFDAQVWTKFLQANPSLLGNNDTQSPQPEQDKDSVDCSGIERLHQLLDESSTPREYSNIETDTLYHGSPAPYFPNAPSRALSRVSTPQCQQQKRGLEEAFRPSSRTSIRSYHPDIEMQSGPPTRRGSMSGYGSADEIADGPMQKRARLIRHGSSERLNTNIERLPVPLRVAASTAASVRIHRPTPLHPNVLPQTSGEEPVRPPTPIPSDMPLMNRRTRAPPSNLRRESTTNSQISQVSGQIGADDGQIPDTSPEDTRYGSVMDTPFNMPSSPPVMNNVYPQTSSPVLPPMPDHDSGFMSGQLESVLDDYNCNPTVQRDNHRAAHAAPQQQKVPPPSANFAPNSTIQNPPPMSDGLVDFSTREGAPSLPPQPKNGPSSRPSSRTSMHRPSKSAPTKRPPTLQSSGQPRDQVPASDPVQSAPMSLPPAPPSGSEIAGLRYPGIMTSPTLSRMTGLNIRTGPGSRRSKQVQAKLEQCIEEGIVPPFCENCGSIDTPTWRRAWSKIMEGNVDFANSHNDDSGMLYWEAVDTDEQGDMITFRLYKKCLSNEDMEYVQLLLCNPCGLWLHKFKYMRPENKWHKPPQNKRKKKKPTAKQGRKRNGTTTRSQTRLLACKETDAAELSSVPDAPFTAGADEVSPKEEKTKDKKKTAKPKTKKARAPRKRANTTEPTTVKEYLWQQENPGEALQRAIQSSPARNMEVRHMQFSETNLTPKPVRRALFTSKDGPGPAMKTLSDAFINGMQRSPRAGSKNKSAVSEKENKPPTLDDGLDELFETAGAKQAENIPVSPTPKRRSPRIANKYQNAISPSRVLQLSPRASRINDITRTSRPPPASPQKGFNARSLASIEPLDFNIFDSELDLGNHDDSNLFSPSKFPADDSWVDWFQTDHLSASASPDEETFDQKRPNTSASLATTIKDLTSPAFAQGDVEVDNENFHSLLGESSGVAYDADIFTSRDLADQQLMDLWSKATDTPGVDGGMGDMDETVLAAIMQEVNDNGNGNGNGKPDEKALTADCQKSK